MKKNITVLIVLILAIIIIYVAYKNSQSRVDNTSLINTDQSQNVNTNREGAALEGGEINTSDIDVEDLEDALSEVDELKSDLEAPDVDLEVSFE